MKIRRAEEKDMDRINELLRQVCMVHHRGRPDLFQSEYILLANKIVLKQSQYLNSCMRHFSWIVGTYSDMIPRVIFKPILEYILISYTPYFNGETSWDISYARKDEFEKGLLNIYSTFRNWGGENSFWKSYKPRFVNV